MVRKRVQRVEAAPAARRPVHARSRSRPAPSQSPGTRRDPRSGPAGRPHAAPGPDRRTLDPRLDRPRDRRGAEPARRPRQRREVQGPPQARTPPRRPPRRTRPWPGTGQGERRPTCRLIRFDVAGVGPGPWSERGSASHAPRRGPCPAHDLGWGHPCPGPRRRGPKGPGPTRPSRTIADRLRHPDPVPVARAERLWDQALAARRPGSRSSRRSNSSRRRVASTTATRPKRSLRRHAAPEWLGLGRDAAVVVAAGELHLPGSGDPTVGCSGYGCRDLIGTAGPGRITSPAVAPLGNDARVGRDPGLGVGPHGPIDEDATRLARSSTAGSPRVARGVACEQPGGMRQQRGADAASAAPHDSTRSSPSASRIPGRRNPPARSYVQGTRGVKRGARDPRTRSARTSDEEAR